MALIAVVSGACAPSVADRIDAPLRSIETTQLVRAVPHERAVILETSACGRADGTTGSGVIVTNGLVATAAHVVIAATSISVGLADGLSLPGSVVALDVQRDLAIVAVDGAELPSVTFSSAAEGDSGLMVGGARSGTIPFKINRKVRVEIDEVRGTERSKRDGYEVGAATGAGDSGAGLYNNAGELVGIVFATSTIDTSITWATASSELTPVLDAVDLNVSYHCDPAASRITTDHP